MAAGAATAGNGNGPGRGHHAWGGGMGLRAYVPAELLDAITQNPSQSFDVIIQGERKEARGGFFKKFTGDSYNGVSFGNRVRQQFSLIGGAEATLTGNQIIDLAKKSYVTSIQANETVELSGGVSSLLQESNPQLWPWATGAPVDWLRGTPDAGTIAVVDSGIDANRSDFTGRIVGQVNMTSLAPNATGDGYGHGTFVSSIAAGSAPGYAGAAPKADILSIDVMNDQGQATVADVVKAADWILANKTKYNIKVANFSLHSVNKASILFDPLDQAVEKLWLNGIVVVAAAGNYGTGATASGVEFAPGNDPLVITVGATDLGKYLGPGDDTNAPFSAWGYTPDGFAKPDLAAPGRYMIGAVPTGSTLTKLKPANVTDPVNGYMQLSGTSFSAPVVSGVAATLMAQHPTWTPDQVKGALMVTATPEPHAAPGSLGVGEVNIAGARAYTKRTPPNPNAALDKFITSTSDGTKVFDSASWQNAAKSNKAWDDAAWSDAAWSDAAWSDAAWSDVAWADVAFDSMAYGTVAWSDVAWSDAAWADAAWADNANDPAIGDVTDTSSLQEDQALAALGIVNDTCDPTISVCLP